jgi:prepilin-type N-terminal cleavage/methylation domain-containing protein
MTLTDTRRGRRPGFTLIELLVVLAILTVLVGLTAAGVMKFLGKGPEAVCRSELAGLSTARSAFLQEFRVSHMPSSLVLREDNNYDTTGNPAHRRTVAFLQQMFGKRIDLRRAGSAPGANGIDWNGDGTISKRDLPLTGDQCLVFFLGGIPAGTGAAGGTLGCTGFSSDPANPAAVAGTRRGPFYEFKSNRLIKGPNNFLSYADPFRKNKPFAYFSAGAAGNDYSPDCPSLMVSPYVESSTAAGERYINPDGFQIISAGPDGVFGPGGTAWDPATGYGSGAGADDLANFSAGRLGAPRQ